MTYLFLLAVSVCVVGVIVDILSGFRYTHKLEPFILGGFFSATVVAIVAAWMSALRGQ